ncbi:hypothetical protein LAZ67_3000368 [Cordylochernes scorpioides]|uniref:Transposase n=1 Tax=Cordylochernes scorpioides TaxID=51811 RepID=A0ABY6K6E6_9ARAC|nr:hypothetical protein LAZ67_3000368 [Cordylochernes scorpioides]
MGIMRCLREAVRLKRPERWQNNDWILHVGNARPHTAHVVLQFLAKHSTIQIPHPPYSPDLAPNDFFLYPKLKMNLKGRKFDNVDMIQAESKATLRNLSKSDFISCFDNWKKIWNGFLERTEVANYPGCPSDLSLLGFIYNASGNDTVDLLLIHLRGRHFGSESAPHRSPQRVGQELQPLPESLPAHYQEFQRELEAIAL